MPSRERKIKKQELDEMLSASNLGALKGFFPLERLTTPDIYSGGLVTVYPDDPDGHVYLHPNIGRGGNDSRAGTKEEAILELKYKHRDIWGKRGVAHIIRKREFDAGREISLRTIQQYMKDSK